MGSEINIYLGTDKVILRLSISFTQPVCEAYLTTFSTAIFPSPVYLPCSAYSSSACVHCAVGRSLPPHLSYLFPSICGYVLQVSCCCHTIFSYLALPPLQSPFHLSHGSLAFIFSLTSLSWSCVHSLAFLAFHSFLPLLSSLQSHLSFLLAWLPCLCLVLAVLPSWPSLLVLHSPLCSLTCSLTSLGWVLAMSCLVGSLVFLTFHLYLLPPLQSYLPLSYLAWLPCHHLPFHVWSLNLHFTLFFPLLQFLFQQLPSEIVTPVCVMYRCDILSLYAIILV